MMNRIGKWGLAALVVFSLVYATAAQDATPTVDQILDKYVTALGGKANLEKITSRYYKGTVEVPEFGASGTVEYFAKAPNKFISIADIPGSGIRRSAFDGNVGWTEDPQVGIREASGNDLLDTKRGAEFYIPLKFRSLYSKISLKGKEKYGSRDAWVVLVETGFGPVDTIFFDAETGLLIGTSVIRDAGQGPVTFETFNDEYKLFDGVQVATIRRRVTPQFTVITRFTDIKHNVSIDDSRFSKPATP